jgi:outer membrane immunogenic protein
MTRFNVKIPLLASVFLLSATSAYAADYEPPPPVDDLRPASYDWSGLYVGAWVGNGCLDESTLDDGTTPLELDGCGFKGGVSAGYNHQIQDWVLGVEVDYGLGSTIEHDYDPTASGDDFSFNSLGTARMRFGYAFDDTLLFITGGGAYLNAELTGQARVGQRFKVDEDVFGWTIGGGIEHAVTDNFRLRLDYLYTQFSDVTYHPCPVCNVDTDFGGEHEVRIGGVWAFNWF